jgi:hypothetical protein
VEIAQFGTGFKVTKRMAKLQVGSVIRVRGFVMLAKLEEGDYRVSSMPPYHGIETYQFTKPKGKKVIVRHPTDSVDLWIGIPENLNGIEIISSPGATK